MENTKRNAILREITLKDIWDIFVRRLWAMLLAAVIAVSGLFAYVQLTYTPRYQSTATLYILNLDNEDSISSTYNSFTLALKVVNDCTYLLKSHTVLDEVIDELELDISYSQLYKSVSASNPEDTRILEVTVEADSPEEAKEIVDAICSIGPEKIREAMGFDQVNLYEYGILNTKPCNTTGVMTYVLLGVIAAVIVYMIFLIAFLLDDRIRTEEDIQRYLGLSILGEIPNADDSGKKGYGYYRYGSRKYKYGYSRRPYTSQAKAALEEASNKAVHTQKESRSENAAKAGKNRQEKKSSQNKEKVSARKGKN